LWGEGDEFHAVFETTTGYTVVFDPQRKAYFYAVRAADGKSLVPTGVLAHRAPPAGLGQHIRMDRDAMAAAARARQQQWDKDMRLSERWTRLKSTSLGAPLPQEDGGPLPAPPPLPTTGTKVGLTLLIDFSDDVATVSQAEIDAFCNSDNYTRFGNNGSVKKYFSDVSAGRLTYQNVVTLYVRMTQPKSYYDDTSKECGEQGNLLIKDALAILKASEGYSTTILPTFNSLTVDANNWVVAFNVFFAGANSGVWSFGLWPHSWVLNNGVRYTPVDLGNGKLVCPYQITDIGASLELGTFCHENGHMLCDFPDIYDYDYDSVGGAGDFCLMSYGGSGGNPSQVCAYLKLAAGWATVTDINSASDLTATLVAAPNAGYDHLFRYRRPNVSTEYFLMENRQKAGRDAQLPGAGIAVWHIDELGSRDDQRMLPNSIHQNYEVTLVQADNLWHFETTTSNSGDANDLYYEANGAISYANRLDNLSSPNSHWWDGIGNGPE
jgi:M6 family metalloprotease-like protein